MNIFRKKLGKIISFCALSSVFVFSIPGNTSQPNTEGINRSNSPWHERAKEVLGTHTHTEQNKDVFIAAKAFNQHECERYLGKNLLKNGFQPIQIIIKNHSNKPLFFSPNNVSFPCTPLDQVIASARTSTAGRAAGYGAGALFSCGLLAIPAIVDGVGSSNANKLLESDYYCKAAKKQVIEPNSMLNGLLFVSPQSLQSSFKIKLIEEGSSKSHTYSVSIR